MTHMSPEQEPQPVVIEPNNVEVATPVPEMTKTARVVQYLREMFKAIGESTHNNGQQL